MATFSMDVVEAARKERQRDEARRTGDSRPPSGRMTPPPAVSAVATMKPEQPNRMKPEPDESA